MKFRSLVWCLLVGALYAADDKPSLAPAPSLASSPALAAGEDIEDRDIQALREWINTKRQVTVKELGGALSISGEVRAEFQSSNETIDGIQQRGAGSVNGTPRHGYDVEFVLLMDYRTDRTWTAVKVKFDNDAGIVGGTKDRIALDRALFAVRVVDADTWTTDIEVGRRFLSEVFDSQIEFGSRFDGILFKYDQAFDVLGAFYIHAGPFLINERQNQYGYVGEIGLLQIANTGFYTKYSLIDWDTKHLPHHFSNGTKNTYILNDERYQFLVSQFILGYKFVPKNFPRVIKLYAAGLVNGVAKPLEVTDHSKQNWGGYVGLSIGELKKQGDWNFDGNYQVVQAQAIPDFDINGVGLGNAAKTGFLTTNSDGTGSATTRKTAQGNTNYRGYTLRLQYLLTNNLNLFQSWQQSQTLDSRIGPYHRFKQYEIEFIYVF